MNTNILSLTRNNLWVPNRLTTQKHSTLDRLSSILSRSMIFGYVRLAYNTESMLLLREIKGDLDYEINDIRNSSIREEGIYDSENDGREVEPEFLQNTLAVCDMMVGNIRSSLDFDLEPYIKNKFNLALAEYYNMVYKKRDGEETIKSINDVYIAGLRRSGMSICRVNQVGKMMTSVVTLDSSTLSTNGSPNIIGFMSCVSFINSTSDMYMSWLASMCIEPDNNMLEGPCLPLGFVNRWFSPMTIDETVHTLARGCSFGGKDSNIPAIRFVTDFLVKLRDKQNIRLGQATNIVLKSALGKSNYIDKDIIYVLELLTSKNTPSENEDDTIEIEQEYIDAFKQSDLYTPSMDITSEYFVEQVAAEGDEEEPEEPTDEEEDVPPEEGEEEEPTDVDEEPMEGDDAADDAEPTEPVDRDISKTNDKKGVEITVQEGKSTLDEYLYRREVGFILTKLLENPPEKMSAEKLAILKDIKTHWLYICDVKTIHETLSSIIDLKIKVKTEKAA